LLVDPSGVPLANVKCTLQFRQAGHQAFEN